MVAANVRDWGHCPTVFALALHRRRCSRSVVHGPVAGGCRSRDGFRHGVDLHAGYLEPLSETPELSAVIETGARVDLDRKIGNRQSQQRRPRGTAVRPRRWPGPMAPTDREPARAVIDASGTWTNPNPLGADGLPAEGEAESSLDHRLRHSGHSRTERATYSGRTTLVVGGGHSAANVLLDLLGSASAIPRTRILWAIRNADPARIFGGGAADELPARGELGAGLRARVAAGDIEMFPGFAATAVQTDGAGARIRGETAKGPLGDRPH